MEVWNRKRSTKSERDDENRLRGERALLNKKVGTSECEELLV